MMKQVEADLDLVLL